MLGLGPRHMAKQPGTWRHEVEVDLPRGGHGAQEYVPFFQYKRHLIAEVNAPNKQAIAQFMTFGTQMFTTGSSCFNQKTAIGIHTATALDLLSDIRDVHDRRLHTRLCNERSRTPVPHHQAVNDKRRDGLVDCHS